MEAAEAPNDATPPLIEGEEADNVELNHSFNQLDDTMEESDDSNDQLDESINVVDVSDEQIVVEGGDPAESKDEPMPGETEAGREVAEAVIEHAEAAAIEEPAIEEARKEDDAEEQAELEDRSTGDTPPMYEEEGAGDEPPLAETVESAETTETSETSGAATTPPDAEVKDESPPIVDESIQPPPESSEKPAEEQVVPGNLPATFPHCYVCGFDRETAFKREKKANNGPHKNKLIYKNQCVRKACARFFGPSYIWDGRIAEYVRIAEESAAASRPFTSGPNTTKKFPANDYHRAGPSGVQPPVETNGVWLREGQANPFADPDASASSLMPPPPLPPQKASSSTSTPGTSYSRPAPAAQKTASQKAKKLRKGYQWVPEEDMPARPDPIIELARMYAAQNAMETAVVKASKPKPSRTFGTQTGDEDQIILSLMDDMRTKAVFPGIRSTGDVPMTPSNIKSFSNRLYLTQKTLKVQSDEIKKLRAERNIYRENFKKIMKLLEEYRKTLVIDTTRLKEDLVVANKEIRNYAREAQNEAEKDLVEINRIKEHVAQRIDDSDRYRRKIEASVEFQKSITREAEILSDNYHRMAVELERKIIACKIDEEDAKRKLNDKIYLTNNAKCGHCQVFERIKKMLTEQLGEKTLSANNLSKEREALAKKLENTERIVSIVGKENSQLKYEKAAWETNCHRFKNELMQLKGNNAHGLVLPSSLPSAISAPGEAAFTPQSTTTKDADEVTPERMEDEVVEMERPPPATSTSSAEEGEYQSPGISPNTLARLPPPPPPPTASQLQKVPSPPDHAPGFASWIPKDRKVQEMPPEMAEAMRKVAESLERGPPPKKDEKGGGPHKKKEKRDEKGSGGGLVAGGKRSGGPQQFGSSHSNKNGEKKPKLDGAARREDRVHHPPPPAPRPIPTIGTKGGMTSSPPVATKDKRRDEKMHVPSPVPFSSAHEPAFPAVVAPKKPSVKVPYNGPSSLEAGRASSSKPSSSHSSPHPAIKNSSHKGAAGGTPEKKKPLCFLPVAGSLGIPPLAHNPRDAPPRAVTADSIIRVAERLKAIERDREQRGGDPYLAASAAAADRRAGMQPLMGGGGAPGFSSGFDDDLPWNAGPRGGGGTAGAPNYQQSTTRPRTPVQDWYYDAPAPQQQQRPPSPGRYFDDMYNPHAPRDQYGRLEPDFGMVRHPHHLGGPPPAHLHPHPHPHPIHPPGHPGHRGAPPPQGPPPHQAPHPQDAWRREWHGEPPRRNYWE